jgi:hypothetical protein
MSASSSSSSTGIGFTGVLQIVFIVLKLCHQIEWSWWWVLSPVWITVAIVILILIVCAVLALWSVNRKQ